jgi:hypothetical protein
MANTLDDPRRVPRNLLGSLIETSKQHEEVYDPERHKVATTKS